MPIQPFQEVVDDFVQNQRELKGERTYETYGRKVHVFKEYMEQRGYDNIIGYRAFLHDAGIEEVLESVRYYITTYEIKYKTTSDSYIAALKVFFDFLKGHSGIHNEFFSVNSKEKSLRDAYEILCKELNLNKKAEAMPISEMQCSCLLATCDKNLDQPTVQEVLNGKNNGVFSLYISSLISKFVLLYGTKNKVLSELSIDDYDAELNKITINGYGVHLPDGLSRQMKKYILVRKEIISDNALDNRLFIDLQSNKNWMNAKMFLVLEQVIGNKKATSIAKYALMQLLKNNVPFNLVMEFTGYSQDVCGHCQELLDEERGIFHVDEKNRKLDSALRQSIIFDRL